MVILNNQKLNFSVPITESVMSKEKSLTIKGTAINEGTTRNKTIFTGEELSKGANSLNNKPLLKDHNNSVDSIVGKVTKSSYDVNAKCISFEACVMDEPMKQKIEMGLVGSVSVGAMCDSIEECYTKSENGEETFEGYKVSGINFVELSLVAVPADPNANFAKAICEKFDSNSNSKLSETPLTEVSKDTINNIEVKQMAEEISKLEAIKQEKAILEEQMEAMKLEMLKVQKEKMEKELAEAKKVEVKETAVVENKTKGEVSTINESPKSDNYVVEQSSETIGVAVYQDYKTNSNLKRLVR
jgi:hypothetical protein